MSDNFFINSLQGNDDLEKVTVATVVAGAAAAKDSKIAIFLTCEAVSMTPKGGMESLQREGYPLSPTCR
jgi:predicted peroxiredoxin